MRILLGLLAAMVVATPSVAQKIDIVVPPPAATRPLEAPETVQPVTLSRLAANMPSGKPWMIVQGGLLCVTDQTLRWTEKDNQIGEDAAFKRIFREEMAKAGFKMSGDPTNLFGAAEAPTDLQIGALVTDIRMRLCFFRTDFGDVAKGAAVMDVEWQVFSVTQNRLLARIPTHGGYEATKFAKNISQLAPAAFRDNVVRLAASDAFRQAVREGAARPAEALSPLPIAGAPIKKIPLAESARGVVSIFAGDSLGSGVLISNDGYVLTNHHVAGSSGRVRVRWPDGSDSVGEVIRGDSRRDVALIKTDPKGHAVAMRHPPAQLGETVFAIGTPLDKELAGTLTRGVVSANRVIQGQSWIQSDVTVNHGNSGGPLLDESGAVIGLTAWGMAPDGAPVGLNFFIPIDDALRALALKPTA
jgi:serine protease Do